METDVPLEQQAEVAKGFLEGLVAEFGHQATVAVHPVDEDTVEVRVTGDDLGLLIGPKGQTLGAIQELARTVVQRQTGAHNGRLIVDVAGYRQARRRGTGPLHPRSPAQVVDSGQPAALEPMTPADRKVVHDTANEIEGVSTASEGEDPRRRVVILPRRRVLTQAGPSGELLGILAEARTQGMLGPGPVEDHIAHAAGMGAAAPVGPGHGPSIWGVEAAARPGPGPVVALVDLGAARRQSPAGGVPRTGGLSARAGLTRVGPVGQGRNRGSGLRAPVGLRSGHGPELRGPGVDCRMQRPVARRRRPPGGSRTAPDGAADGQPGVPPRPRAPSTVGRTPSGADPQAGVALLTRVPAPCGSAGQASALLSPTFHVETGGVGPPRGARRQVLRGAQNPSAANVAFHVEHVEGPCFCGSRGGTIRPPAPPDHGHRQPEGRRGQDHHGGEPGRGAGRAGLPGAGGRPRSPGQRHHRPRASTPGTSRRRSTT